MYMYVLPEDHHAVLIDRGFPNSRLLFLLLIFTSSVFLDDFVADADVSEFFYEQVPFNHPLFIMFSSGTTGVPKCMVHSVGVSMITYSTISTIVKNVVRSQNFCL